MNKKALEEPVAITMLAARQEVDREGLTEGTMHRIGLALKELAGQLVLSEYSGLREMHGTDAAASVLASEGPEGLTLVLARFPPGSPTPIHDHGTWGVAYVVSGHDLYTHWSRMDDASDSRHATLSLKYEKSLGPGDTVYWFGPPEDIHSQQGDGEAVWELVLFGKNTMQIERHYFDPVTGSVTSAMPH